MQGTSNVKLAKTYDQIPYEHAAYQQTRPDWLATIATIFGMKPAPVERCRVLELGCGSGGNLIPLAEQFPGAEFVGLDLSARQIADGHAIIAPLNLKNLKLEQRDILDLGDEIGAFDYIIAHGVYSWVPPAVQDKLLAICRQNLTDQGVAYISYNTYPGWRGRAVIREMMLYRAGGQEDPVERLRLARSVVAVIAKSVPVEFQGHAFMLKQELEELRQSSDSYLLHDHLEEHNTPVYFHDFMRLAQAKGLQYLGESDVASMALANLRQPLVECLNALAKDLAQAEQYLDFAINRMFRQTLLCRREVSVNRHPSMELIQSFRIVSRGKPEVIAASGPGKKTTFRWADEALSTADPLLVAALMHLGQIWPRSIPMIELIEIVSSRTGPAEGVPAEKEPRGRHLAALLARCFFSRQVEFSIHPDTFVTSISDRPVAGQYARLRAAISNSVVNQRHLMGKLDETRQQIIRHLDGSHDRNALVQELLGAIRDGSLVMKAGERPIEEDAKLRRELREKVDLALSYFAQAALLIA